jgi:putative transposase
MVAMGVPTLITEQVAHHDLQPEKFIYDAAAGTGTPSGPPTPHSGVGHGQARADFQVRALKQAQVQISMDGKGRALDNIFTERLWRTVKYEEVYLHEYMSPKDA